MASDYYSGLEIFNGARNGKITFNPVGWSTDIAPLDILTGKFHGPNSVDDLAVLNGNGTISIPINITQ